MSTEPPPYGDPRPAGRPDADYSRGQYAAPSGEPASPPPAEPVLDPPPGPAAGSPFGSSFGSPPAFNSQDVQSKKLTAGLCGILLGTFGVHKFILGFQNAGIIMLAVSIASLLGGIATCGITLPVTGVMGIIGLVEGILYLTKSDEDFYRDYVVGKKEWF